MHDIKKLANKNKIKIIEDCSQAHGASIDNMQVGSFGDVSTWSFCNDKIISTLGEGGMISTNKKIIYDFCKTYINHGSVLQNNKNSEKFIYNKDYFGTNLRITEIQSIAGLEQLKDLRKVQIKRERMSKDYFHVTSKYQNYIYSYFPLKNIKCAWYRFYFFLKTDMKEYQKIRFKIIKNLKKNDLKCFTGSCPEIYLEKSFKKLKNFKVRRLINSKILGETSIALDINHTLTHAKHKKKVLELKLVLEDIFQNKLK
jgi:dTDP-4-amino-4,6-dideoxygalactose transaminase